MAAASVLPRGLERRATDDRAGANSQLRSPRSSKSRPASELDEVQRCREEAHGFRSPATTRKSTLHCAGVLAQTVESTGEPSSQGRSPEALIVVLFESTLGVDLLGWGFCSPATS